MSQVDSRILMPLSEHGRLWKRKIGRDSHEAGTSNASCMPRVDHWDLFQSARSSLILLAAGQASQIGNNAALTPLHASWLCCWEHEELFAQGLLQVDLSRLHSCPTHALHSLQSADVLYCVLPRLATLLHPLTLILNH